MKKIALTFLVLPVLVLTGCNVTKEPTPPPVVKTFFETINHGNNKIYPASLGEFTPTLFSSSSVTHSSSILGDGVEHISYVGELNSAKKFRADVIKVDLTKANIRSNYATDGIATVYDQMIDFEENNTQKVMAAINADFFATGRGTSVNAYVKDNEIIKDRHNDKGRYDYTDLEADIPASMPMLFGVNDQQAKIAPIIENGTVEETIKSTFTYNIVYWDEDLQKEVLLSENVSINQPKLEGDFKYNVITKNISSFIPSGAHIIQLNKYSDSTSSLGSGKIVSFVTRASDTTKVFTNCDKYNYIITTENTFDQDSLIALTVNSSDDSWKYYSTIIGGRQSLVENGEIAPTVTLENSNGAQRTNIPRSGVGVINESTVAVVAFEALRYGGTSNNEEDPYGVSLPEMAEFMRYIGCYDALNFDGGGSTKLITKNNNGAGEATTVVRSSDDGKTTPETGRKVFNTLLITTR